MIFEKQKNGILFNIPFSGTGGFDTLNTILLESLFKSPLHLHLLQLHTNIILTKINKVELIKKWPTYWPTKKETPAITRL